MSKIDEPKAMELAPIAEARMIFERASKIDFFKTLFGWFSKSTRSERLARRGLGDCG